MYLKHHIAIGQRFGRWIVVSEAGEIEVAQRGRKYLSRAVLCRCDCGAERRMRARLLVKSRSCGCLNHDQPNSRKRGTALSKEERTRAALENVEMLPWSGCWIYMGDLAPSGYGSIKLDQHHSGFVHRLVYELLVGPIPEGLQLDHVKKRGCVSKACCNPDHLEPVTPQENTLRANERTHCQRGHEMTPDNVIAGRLRNEGVRCCRLCALEHARAWKRRQSQRKEVA